MWKIYNARGKPALFVILNLIATSITCHTNNKLDWTCRGAACVISKM